MKRTLLILLLAGLMIPACHAADVTLTWDVVDGAEGYKLFARSGEYPYDYDVPIWEGAFPPAVVSLDDGTTWYLVVRAYAQCGEPPEYCESADSNEASWHFIDHLTAGATGFAISWEVIDEPPPTPSTQTWDRVTLPDGSILFVPWRQ